ncbi:hypothetical protein V6N13_074672 [Hibiscus sabdariffa]|uniref:Uncharacterized protein n=1 Tax=Hibiscus sabdariffa TaxID=183260 RepID=A0ABR2U9B0_9ROSI
MQRIAQTPACNTIESNNPSPQMISDKFTYRHLDDTTPSMFKLTQPKGMKHQVLGGGATVETIAREMGFEAVLQDIYRAQVLTQRKMLSGVLNSKLNTKQLRLFRRRHI